MGLPMEDIHTPTVPSGPTTGYGAANGVEHDRLSLLDLMAEKDRVEAELSALGSVLDSVCSQNWRMIIWRQVYAYTAYS